MFVKRQSTAQLWTRLPVKHECKRTWIDTLQLNCALTWHGTQVYTSISTCPHSLTPIPLLLSTNAWSDRCKISMNEQSMKHKYYFVMLLCKDLIWDQYLIIVVTVISFLCRTCLKVLILYGMWHLSQTIWPQAPDLFHKQATSLRTWKDSVLWWVSGLVHLFTLNKIFVTRIRALYRRFANLQVDFHWL